MGIKNIHIVLISASVLLCLFFGLWSVNNGHGAWGVVSFIIAAGLIIYAIDFVKKAKKL